MKKVTLGDCWPSTVMVTETNAPELVTPGIPLGITTVSWVAERTDVAGCFTPPKLTTLLAAELVSKPVPVIVVGVVLPTTPGLGENDAMVGNGFANGGRMVTDIG